MKTAAISERKCHQYILAMPYRDKVKMVAQKLELSYICLLNASSKTDDSFLYIGLLWVIQRLMHI